MKRFYVIAPGILFIAFLVLYSVWAIRERKRFQNEGPGLLSETTYIMTEEPLAPGSRSGIYYDWRPGPIRDEKKIQRVVFLLDPSRSRWSDNFPLPERLGVGRIFFHTSGNRTIMVLLGKNFATCGHYGRMLSTDAVQEIRLLLTPY